MEVKLKPWGNSQGIRLPKTLLNEAGFQPDDTLVARAENSSDITAARIPFTLLAAILIPIPVPQTRRPFSALPDTTSSATFRAYSG